MEDPDTLAWGSTIHGRLALGPMVEPYQRGWGALDGYRPERR